MNTVNAIFGRVGSKRKLKKEITSMIPPFELYVEPFIGGGSVFLNTPIKGKSIINDKDKQLIKAWKQLKKGVKGNIETYNTYDLVKQKEWYNMEHDTELGSLVKYILQANNTFGSKGVGKLFKNSNPHTKLKKLPQFKEKLKSTKILNNGGIHVIKKYDHEDTFFYIDPPYSQCQDRIGNNASKNLYVAGRRRSKHATKGLGNFNIKKLAKCLSTIKGKFILSLSDTSDVRKLFENYTIRGFETGGDGNSGIGAKVRKEVYIYNF